LAPSTKHLAKAHRSRCVFRHAHLITANRRHPLTRQIIHTDQAPQAIGTYSQAVRVGDTVYLSGQIPLVPATMELVDGDMEAQIRRVFDNLQAVARATDGDLSDVVKLNIFLTDLAHFPLVNQLMAEYFNEPYPARAAIGVASLPKGAAVEMDAVMVLGA
jgi:reactive intermediate/imine deaminase